MADSQTFSELKKLKLPALKDKLLALGIDTRGNKAELLVKLECHLKGDKRHTCRDLRGDTTCASLPATQCICPVCSNLVDDQSTGQESVFCEGVCKAWFHRQCAGLSVAVFQAISSSDSPFLCYGCSCRRQADEILSLRESVEALSKEILDLRGQID